MACLKRCLGVFVQCFPACLLAAAGPCERPYHGMLWDSRNSAVHTHQGLAWASIYDERPPLTHILLTYKHVIFFAIAHLCASCCSTYNTSSTEHEPHIILD
eukprot:1156039-Pelagomonas_calceolata.AAC.7